MSHSIPDIIPELIELAERLEAEEKEEDVHPVFKALLSGIRVACERIPDGFHSRRVQAFYGIRIEGEEVVSDGSEEEASQPETVEEDEAEGEA